MRFKKFMLMVKLSVATFMILGSLVGGGFVAYISMTDGTVDSVVNVDTGDGSFFGGNEEQRSDGGPVANDYPPPESVLEDNTINQERYAWDSLRDPDDPGESDMETSKAHLDSEEIEYYIFQKVNDIRREHGLEPFKHSNYLASVSRAHSEDMGQREYFSHENPEGEHIWHRFRSNTEERSDCARLSENIAKNWVNVKVENGDGIGTTVHQTEEDVASGLVSQWMHSQGHREAILNPQYEVMGIGVYVDDSYRFEYRNNVAATHATQGFCDIDGDST